MKKIIYLAIILSLSFACSSPSGKKNDKLLAEQIRNNGYFTFTKQKALEIMKTGFNAGEGYREVWIRDYNTFIELAGEVHPAEELKENLLVFFRMQGEDGNIIDGFTPIDTVGKVAGKSVADRLEWAMQYLLDDRFNKQYGLIFGATTAEFKAIRMFEGFAEKY